MSSEVPRRRLVAAAFGFTLGVLYGPAVHPILDLIGGVFLIGVGRRRRFKIPVFAHLFSAAGAFLIGVTAPGLMLDTEESLSNVPGAFADEGIALEGMIAEAPDHGLLADGLILDVDLPAKARILVRVAEACGGPRDRIRVTARLSPRRPSLLPSFRSRRLAVRRGVHLYGEAIGECTLVDSGRSGAVGRVISSAIVAADPRHAELLAGLATGIRPDARSSEAPFVKAGLGSVLELHGLAMAFIAGLAFLASRRRPLAVLVLFPLVLVFGATPSILRVAVVLGCLFLPFALKDLDTLDSLAVSVIAALAISPAGLGDVRFQLAFAAISAGLRFPKPAHPAGKIIASAMAVALGTIPLGARLFDHVTLTSLVAAPFVLAIVHGIVTPLAVIGGGLASMASILGAPFLWMGGAILEVIIAVLPATTLGRFPTPTVLECVLFYAAVAVLAAPRDPERLKYVTRGRLSLLLFGSCIASMVIGSLPRSRDLTAWVLPATRGRAYVIEHPELGILVRDTAEPAAWFQMEQRIVTNHLKLHRRTRIDALLIRGSDDPAAAEELMSQVDVGRTWPVGDMLFPARGHTIAFVESATASASVVVDGSRVVFGERIYDTDRDGLIRITLGDTIEVTPFLSAPSPPRGP